MLKLRSGYTDSKNALTILYTACFCVSVPVCRSMPVEFAPAQHDILGRFVQGRRGKFCLRSPNTCIRTENVSLNSPMVYCLQHCCRSPQHKHSLVKCADISYDRYNIYIKKIETVIIQIKYYQSTPSLCETVKTQPLSYNQPQNTPALGSGGRERFSCNMAPCG